MINKSIVWILIVLILINSIGCFPLTEVKPDNLDDIKKEEVIRITTQDDKVYYLIYVEFQNSKILGYGYVNEDKSISREVVILAEEIKKIEVREFDGFLSAVVIVAVGGIVVGFAALIYGLQQIKH